jgi:hypothetical protein
VAGEIHRRFADDEIEVRAGEHLLLAVRLQGPECAWPERTAGRDTARGQTLDEAPARHGPRAPAIGHAIGHEES